jgi:uncharacterized protein (TIGR03067 family)
MRRLFAVVTVVALMALPGCKSAEEIAKEKAAAEADLKQLEGRWRLASQDAEEGNEEVKTPGEIRIEDGVWKSDDENFPRQRITVYPLKTPKTIDLVAVKEDGKTPEIREYKKWVPATKKKAGYSKTVREEYKVLGLYKIEGDTLTAVFSYDDKRPTELSKGPDRRQVVYKKVGGAADEKKDGDKKDGEKKDGEKKDGEKKDDAGKLKEPKEVK